MCMKTDSMWRNLAEMGQTKVCQKAVIRKYIPSSKDLEEPKNKEPLIKMFITWTLLRSH